MTNYVSINGNVIRSNRKHGLDDPPIRIVKSRGDRFPRYAREIVICGSSRINYTHEPSLKCGARVVLETECEVQVLR